MTANGLSPTITKLLKVSLDDLVNTGQYSSEFFVSLLDTHKRTFGDAVMVGPDDDEDEPDTSGGGDDDDDDSDDSSGDDEDDDEDSKRDPKKKISALIEEKDRHVRRRQEEKARADKAELKLQEILDKDKDENQVIREKLATADEQVSKLSSDNNTLRLENAFLTDNNYTWQNPKKALKLVDMSSVEIDDDGQVSGLKDALKALATSDPYLLTTSSKADKDDDAGGVPRVDPSNGRRSKGTKNDRTTLANKYPGLKR